MAQDPAERQAAYRERRRRLREVEAHARRLAGPDPERQARAVRYARWRVEAFESGECRHPYS